MSVYKCKWIYRPGKAAGLSVEMFNTDNGLLWIWNNCIAIAAVTIMHMYIPCVWRYVCTMYICMAISSHAQIWADKTFIFRKVSKLCHSEISTTAIIQIQVKDLPIYVYSVYKWICTYVFRYEYLYVYTHLW